MQPTSPYPPELPQPQANPPQMPPAPPEQAYGPPAAQTQNAAHPHDYAFIMDPETPPPKQSFSLPGGNSKLIRILLVGGGLIALLIIFLVIKSVLFSGGGNLEPFVGLAQQQQELIHITTNAAEEESLSEDNKSAALTTQLSLTSAQSDFLAYLKTNGKKMGEKTLNLKISAAADTQLSSSAAADTYNETFRQVMHDKLTTYRQVMKQTYAQTKGPKGRTLLEKEYKDAGLLLNQF